MQLELKVFKVLQEIKELRGYKEELVLRVVLELKVVMEHKVFKVLLDL